MITVKNASTDDIPAIHSLAHVIWADVYNEILKPAQMAYMLEKIYSHDALHKQMQSGQQFIMAYDGDQKLGFASYSPKDKPDVFKLHKLYIHPGQQGKGVGKYLIDYIIQQIRPLGTKLLELNVNRFNNAVHFYKKLGFKIISEEDVDIGEGYFMNDYVMRLPL